MEEVKKLYIKRHTKYNKYSNKYYIDMMIHLLKYANS